MSSMKVPGGNYFCYNLAFFSFISSIVPLYRLVAIRVFSNFDGIRHIEIF